MKERQTIDYYSILGANIFATQQEIDSLYREKLHSNKSFEQDIKKEIQERIDQELDNIVLLKKTNNDQDLIELAKYRIIKLTENQKNAKKEAVENTKLIEDAYRVLGNSISRYEYNQSYLVTYRDKLRRTIKQLSFATFSLIELEATGLKELEIRTENLIINLSRYVYELIDLIKEGEEDLIINGGNLRISLNTPASDLDNEKNFSSYVKSINEVVLFSLYNGIHSQKALNIISQDIIHTVNASRNIFIDERKSEIYYKDKGYGT